jgi:hypothetical protein
MCIAFIRDCTHSFLSLLQSPDQIQFLLDELVCERGEQKIHNVVCERATDETFHRKVVKSFGVLLLIRLLGQEPALRQNVAHGPGMRLEPIAPPSQLDIDATVEEKGAVLTVLHSFQRSARDHIRTWQ